MGQRQVAAAKKKSAGPPASLVILADRLRPKGRAAPVIRELGRVQPGLAKLRLLRKRQGLAAGGDSCDNPEMLRRSIPAAQLARIWRPKQPQTS